MSEAHQAPREREYVLAQLTRRSFQVVEEKAREILREKGFTEAQIQRELTRPKRKPLEDW